jgi:hypothetical protein
MVVVLLFSPQVSHGANQSLQITTLDSAIALRLATNQKTMDSLAERIRTLSTQVDNLEVDRHYYATGLQLQSMLFTVAVAILLFGTGIVAYFNFKSVAATQTKKEARPIAVKISERIAKHEVERIMNEVNQELSKLYVNTYKSFMMIAARDKNAREAYLWAVKAAAKSPTKGARLYYLNTARFYLDSWVISPDDYDVAIVTEPLSPLEQSEDSIVAKLATGLNTRVREKYVAAHPELKGPFESGML